MCVRSSALVICNHSPPPPPPPPAPGIAARNSRDFDFWSSKSPLKAPPCGDCSLVKPLLFSPAACYLFIHGPVCIFKANPGCSPPPPPPAPPPPLGRSYNLILQCQKTETKYKVIKEMRYKNLKQSICMTG